MPRRFFGMHDADPTSWPGVRVGALRLWDTGTSWRDVETSPGVFDFQRLDAFVAAARSKRARVTLVLGQTPAFHVSSTARPAGSVEYYGAGASRMPDLTAWRTYVRIVAARYAGRIGSLQVWNEPNIIGFWSGTEVQMAQLTYWARSELDAVNRRFGSRTRLVAPSFVARTNTAWIDRYFSLTVSGSRMNDLVDKIALSLYPFASGGPEDAMARLNTVRTAILGVRRVNKPIWITEINYGLAPGGTAEPPPAISSERQAAYVIRTLLLAAAAGVQRVYWYAWDLRGIANTTLSVRGRPTLAGRSFGVTQRWMRHTRLLGCVVAKVRPLRGTYICTLRGPRGVKRIYWNPARRVRVPVSRTASSVTDLHGRTSAIRGQTRTTVDYRPVLVRSTT